MCLFTFITEKKNIVKERKQDDRKRQNYLLLSSGEDHII